MAKPLRTLQHLLWQLLQHRYLRYLLVLTRREPLYISRFSSPRERDNRNRHKHDHARQHNDRPRCDSHCNRYEHSAKHDHCNILGDYYSIRAVCYHRGCSAYNDGNQFNVFLNHDGRGGIPSESCGGGSRCCVGRHCDNGRSQYQPQASSKSVDVKSVARLIKYHQDLILWNVPNGR